MATSSAPERARRLVTGVAQDHVALLDEALLTVGETHAVPAAVRRLLHELEPSAQGGSRLGAIGRDVGLAVDEGHEADHLGDAALERRIAGRCGTRRA